MWDPDQLAEIPVLVDRLLAAGDPLGEWLALRARLDGEDPSLAADERQRLRRRARALRDQLGPRLSASGEPDIGPTLAIRERGLLIDVTLADARPDRLAALLARPDTALLLRLRLGGDPIAVGECVHWLADGSARQGGPALHLRELAVEGLEPDQIGAWLGVRAELRDAVPKLASRLTDLFSLQLDGTWVPLPFAPDALERPAPWSRRRRTHLGRALASRDPEHRRRALERLREHGPVAAQLRGRLLGLIEREDEPPVREAALALIPALGAGAVALLAVLADIAERRDDASLRAWLAELGRPCD